MARDGKKERDTLYHRSMRVSVGMAALATLFTVVYAGPRLGMVYAVAFGWVWVNFRLWEIGLKEFFSRRRWLPMVLLGSAKAVWLVLVLVPAHWAQINRPRNCAVFLLGLSTPFLVMLLKSLGRAITDRTQDKPVRGNEEQVQQARDPD